MLPRESLKRQSSEVARHVYFSIYLYIFNVFKKGPKLHKKGALPETLKIGGHVPLSPLVPASMAFTDRNCYPFEKKNKKKKRKEEEKKKKRQRKEK